MKGKNAYILLYHRADNETSSACPTLDQLHSAMSQESQDFDGLMGELDDDDEDDDNIDSDDNYAPGSHPVDELAEYLEDDDDDDDDDDDENNVDVDGGCARVSQGVHELDNLPAGLVDDEEEDKADIDDKCAPGSHEIDDLARELTDVDINHDDGEFILFILEISHRTDSFRRSQGGTGPGHVSRCLLCHNLTLG